MDISISRRALMVLVGLACAGAMTVAHAAPLSFTVPLTGVQQVPPVETSGTGTANLSYDPGTRVVTRTICTIRLRERRWVSPTSALTG